MEASGDSQLLDTPSGLSSASVAEAVVSAETQTAILTDAAVQYEPPTADAAELCRQLLGPELALFLRGAGPRCEEALQQNELADVMADELAALVDEDGAEGAPTAAGGGTRSASGLVEHQSFSDLVHSTDKVLAAVQWHPIRRGVVGVACTQRQEQHAGHQPPLVSQGSGQLQQPPTGCILLWNHADAIHPEAVLQAPAEVLAFAFHPTQPHWVAAGLATGQVALFSLQQQHPGGLLAAAAAADAAGPPESCTPTAAISTTGQQQHHHHVHRQQRADSGPAAAGVADGGREEGIKAAVLHPAFVSLPEASHKAAITDLQWLPGAAVSRDGRLAAADDASSDACTLFATTAADGSLLLWDMRINTRHRKPAGKDDEQQDWRPVLSLAAASTSKQPLPATRFCPDMRCGAGGGRFLMGSLEGEVVLADGASYSMEHRGNVEWAHNTVQQVAGHTGRILALVFSPFFSDALLAVGDSGFVVWRIPGGAGASGTPSGDGSSGGSEDGGSSTCLALFESPFSHELYTCGCWSPSKPGVVLLGRQDGRLEAWDLLDCTHQPAAVAPVAPCALTSLAVTPAPPAGNSKAASAQMLAVGDAAGTLHLLELPRPLRRRVHAEVKATAALLQREQERLGAMACLAQARVAEQKAEAERSRSDALAAQGAWRKQQQEKAASKNAPAATEEEEQGPGSAERRYLALEAKWRERLHGPVADGGAGGCATRSATVGAA